MYQFLTWFVRNCTFTQKEPRIQIICQYSFTAQVSGPSGVYYVMLDVENLQLLVGHL